MVEVEWDIEEGEVLDCREVRVRVELLFPWSAVGAQSEEH